MSTDIYHSHHIIPRHAGGTDSPDNLVKLTIPEHAEAHRLLYEKYGRWEDKLAWNALSGSIGKDEIIHEKLSQAGKKGAKTLAKKGYKHSPETLKKMSEAKMGEKNHNYGRDFSEEHRKRLSKPKKMSDEGRKKLSECGKNRVYSEETRKKISEAGMGRVPWNKGMKKGSL